MAEITNNRLSGQSSQVSGLCFNTCAMTKTFKMLILLLTLCAVITGSANSPGGQQFPTSTTSFLQRQDADIVRLLNWNVGIDSIFSEGARHESFGRIVRAVSPDVICLQEIDAHKGIGALMSQITPGQNWHIHAVADNVVISRFPLLIRDGEEVVPHPISRLGLEDFHYGYAMVLIDIPNELSDQDLYVVAIHNKSRSGPENIAKRQRQSDAIVSALREQRLGNREGGPPTGTPIVIAGDLNVLQNEWPADDLQHLTTLLTGNIIDEQTYGPDMAIDWDGSQLDDARPSHNAQNEVFYTWRIDQLAFPPGALDRVLYTDSVMTVQHSFVLDTTTMNEDALIGARLLSSDVLLGGTPGRFDHLPMIVDFKMPGSHQ